MRLLAGCKLHHKRGKWTLMVYSGSVQALNVNESFAILWQQFEGKDFSPEDLAAFLVAEYGLGAGEARTQAAKIVELWKEAHLLTP